MGREEEVTVEEEVDGKRVKGVKKEKLVEEVQEEEERDSSSLRSRVNR